jgi:prepilin-type N-terminal cleavage/methylation domain-containing protein
MLSRTKAFNAVRRGFTIIELLVAMLIIGVVLAIVLPAISGARNSARRGATAADLSRLGQAASQYQIDNRRLPGYFPQRAMGGTANGENSSGGGSQRGFSSMQNILLDLAGGVVPSAGTSFGAGGEILEVGPIAGTGSTAFVNLSLIGSTTSVSGATRSNYFSPDRKQFLADQGIVTTLDDHRRLPNYVDPFGTPYLAWAVDEQTGDTAPPPTFALVNFTGLPDIARYYWASNAAFLRSTALGAAQKNQAYASGAEEYSLIGAGRTEEQITSSLNGLIGNAAYPQVGNPGDPAFGGQNRPRIGRAPLVFHSAGTDGVFLSSIDRGGKSALQTSGGIVRYSVNNDPLNNFDDVIGTAGN